MNTEDQDFVLLDDADITGYNEQGLLPLSVEEIATVQRWLNPTDYSAASSEYGKHSSSHLAGTGSWIKETEQYKQWHNSKQGALWIKAIAGAGKSVVAASLAKRLLEEERVPVLYFFFRHIVSANQTPQSLIRDFMSQILDHSLKLQHELHSLIENRHTIESMSQDKMWTMLLSALTSLPRVYCVIDALDEMDTDDGAFLEDLVALGQMKPDSIKLLMTSRPIPRVEQVLRHSSIVQILLQSTSVNPDISKYVRHRVEGFDVSEALSAQIHDTMVNKANGHFLYARLMMDGLQELLKSSPANTEKLTLALDELPQPMADMYTKMLEHHSQRSNVPQNLQMAILQWVTRAERPLRLLEISSMIDIQHINHKVNMDNKAIIRESCGPLLEILEDETVCPIHHSLTEYLYDQDRQNAVVPGRSFPVLNESDVQSALAISCINQLKSGWHRDWLKSVTDGNKQKRQSALRKLKLQYPYLDYSLHHWHVHLTKADTNKEMFVPKLDELLLEDPQMLFAILEASIHPRTYFIDGRSKVVASWTALHAAAHTGLAFFIEHLIKSGCDIECMDTDGHTPLALAASKGHTEVVAALLMAGAAADKDDQMGCKPLHLAALCNHHQVVKILLAAGVDPLTPKTKDPGRFCGNARSSIGDTALQYACHNGHVESIQQFVPYVTPKDLKDALCWALSTKQKKAVQALLQVPGIDVKTDNTDRKSPLFMACKARDATLIRSLIDLGADIHKSFDTRLTSWPYLHHDDDFYHNDGLLQATVSGHYHDHDLQDCDIDMVTESLTVLLDAGIDPNSIGANGSTVLNSILGQGRLSSGQANHNKFERLLSMLFTRGLSPHTHQHDGGNAFHSAKHLSPQVVRLLIDYGVDINHVRSSDNLTPILAALKGRDSFTAASFLAQGADISLTDGAGNTTLHLLAQMSEKESNHSLLEKLISAGADVNARNKDGNTALHHNHELNAKLVTKFVEHGFDLESKNKNGESVFHYFLKYNSLHRNDQCAVMAGVGVDLLTRDGRGRTVLHSIFGQSLDENRIKLARYFVQKGVNPGEVDCAGNTLWHVLASNNSYTKTEDFKAAMNFLLEHNISAGVKNNLGQLPVHVICYYQERSRRSLWPLELFSEYGLAPVNAVDNNKIQPLHLAASFSSELTYWLLNQGATLTASTIEGQNALMVACRNRQPNIVGSLLEHYKHSNQLVHIHQTDQTGRSALHYACRSGVPETVVLLLEAGMKVDVKDKQGLTPLAVCAEYKEEQSFWTAVRDSTNDIARYQRKKMSNVLLHDEFRPVARDADQDPIRIRETIRLLMRYGADMSFLTRSPQHEAFFWRYPLMDSTRSNPLKSAMTRGCDAMISELLSVQAVLLPFGPLTKDIRASWDKCMHQFQSVVQLERLQHTPEAITQHVKSSGADTWLIEQLLRADDEPSVRFTKSLAPEFFRLNLDFKDDHPIPRIVCWGFSELLDSFGPIDSDLIEPWTNEKAHPDIDRHREVLTRILQLSLKRRHPNLRVLKVLIEKIGIDPNTMFEEVQGYKGSKTSVLHVVARPNYWWQTQALEYLIQRGANIEILNTEQDTPLLGALLANENQCSEPLRLKVVATLLSHGANPNAINFQGTTCLNAAARHPQCIKLLLSYGADPFRGSRPFIFDAIKMQDMDVMREIVKAGVNLNITAQEFDAEQAMKAKEWKEQDPSGISRFFNTSGDRLSEWAYPIHVAASHFFNTPEKRSKAIETIDLLLEAGADPNLTYEDLGTSVLHLLAQTGGILGPFFKSACCDLEARDSRGRTLLLAACDPGGDAVGIIPDKDTIKLLIDQGASMEAIDIEGRNMAHYIASGNRKSSSFDVIREQALPKLVSQGDNEGRTPFHYVLSQRAFRVVDFYLEHGADPTISDPRDGTTALHHLATRLTRFSNLLSNPDFIAIIESLSEQQAKAFEEETVLFLINEEIRLEDEGSHKLLLRSPRRLFRTMLKRGLSINARNHKGETPLHRLLATPVHHKSGDFALCLFRILQLLANLHTTHSSAELDFTARSHSGQSALHKLATQSYVRQQELPADDYDLVVQDLRASFTFLVEKGADVTWEDDQSRTCLDVAAACGSKWLLEMFKRK